jgi:hypothetical protein
MNAIIILIIYSYGIMFLTVAGLIYFIMWQNKQIKKMMNK